MATGSKRIILILGMHRSGTSALANAVHLQGALLPKTLMAPQRDNPHGFYESLPVVKLNNRLLQEAGSRWDDPRPIEPDWRRQSAKQMRQVELARQQLVDELPEGELFVLKDPRLSRLMPIWLEAINQCGFEPSVFLCCRNPLEVSASLAKRNGIDIQHAQLLWLSYMLEAEQATRNLPRAIVHYDSLLADWRDTLLRAYDAIGLDAFTLSGEEADAIDEILDNNKRHHKASTDRLMREERISPLVKETYTAFQMRPWPRGRHFDQLYQQVTASWTTLVPSGAAVLETTKTIAKRKTAMTNKSVTETIGVKTVPEGRHIILHYHLFKNAGTSLDQILKFNFKDGWYEHEGPEPGWRAEDIAEYLLQRPEIVVLSSHTALLPSPVTENIIIYPIIFIRHPIDRIRSIYEFERKQMADTEGACMAKQTDLAGYINWRLQRRGDRTIRNFQSYRLSFAAPEMHDGKKLTEQERALRAIETLPFVGVVEHFNESLIKLQAWLKPVFPHIEFKPTKTNVTQDGKATLDERLDLMAEAVGEELYREILKMNELDLLIYDSLAVIFD